MLVYYFISIRIHISAKLSPIDLLGIAYYYFLQLWYKVAFFVFEIYVFLHILVD